MPPEWKGPEQWKPLLDRMVEAEILISWQGKAAEGLRLKYNPNFADGYGGEEAVRGLKLILREMMPPLSMEDLRDMAGFLPDLPDPEPPNSRTSR